jgi:hypothetical protein
MVSTELPTATIARFFPRRRATPVTLAEEGVGSGEPGDDLAEGAGQPWVALAGGVALLAAGRLGVDRGELGPGHQVRGGGEGGHVHPDLGDDLLGGPHADAGDLIQLLSRRRERGG